MKKVLLLILACVLFLYGPSYAQQDTSMVKSVEEAVDLSIHKFRKNIANDDAIIYTIIEVDLNEKNIEFSKNDFIVESGINARKIDYKTDKFLLKFVVSIANGRMFINVIQWRIKKKSQKEIELINLMSGEIYEVVM